MKDIDEKNIATQIAQQPTQKRPLPPPLKPVDSDLIASPPAGLFDDEQAQVSKSTLRVGILSKGDPNDVRTWSGVPFSMKTQLEKRFANVVYLPAPESKQVHWLKRLNWHLHKRTGKKFVSQWTGLRCRQAAKAIREAIKQNPVDVVLAITVDQQVAALDIDVPIVHHSDTTFAGVENYYPDFSDLWAFSRRDGHRITREAIHRSEVSFYPSQWAVDSAVNDYEADPGQMHVVPYGANLQDPPSHDEAIKTDRRTVCRLLWIGVDWQRKGGQITYDTMVELNRRGVDAEMVVVGATPPADCDHEKLTAHGFLNKQVPAELATYQSLWPTSAFFMLPSRGETFGAVFCEAAANGLPAVATRTGGIPDAVKDGQSGILLDPEAGAEAYADAIAQVWNDRAGYENLVHTTRARYEDSLNWEAWADRVAPLIEQAVERYGK